MRKILLALSFVAAFASQAMADWTAKDATPSTITFKNASGACTSVVCVPQAAISDSTGVNIVAVKAASTAAAAGDISFVTNESPNSLLTTTVNGNSATTAHGCSVAGYGVLGCLGQIDDDIKGSIPAGGNTIGAVQTAPNVTPTDCSGSISAGGTAQNAFTAQTTLHGFTIVNIDTTEPMWISFTTTAAASGTGSYPLQAATATTFASPGSFSSPAGFGLNHALSVIAATTSHKFSCTWW